MSTKSYVVYHLLHQRTPYEYIPKLVVTDVPDGAELTRDLFARAGYEFSEFGIPWANHDVWPVNAGLPADLVRRLRNYSGEVIAYGDLVAKANAPLEF